MGCQASVTAQTTETAPWTHTFKDLSNLSSLECSRTRNHQIVINDSKGSVEEFTKMLRNNHGLTELVMADCKLNDSEMEQVAEAMISSKCPLTKLDLSSNQFGVKGAMFLPPLLATKKSLETLRLTGNMVKKEPLGSILQALDIHNPALTSLYIDDCMEDTDSLSDEVSTLANLIKKEGSRLTELSISRITDGSVRKLCEAVSGSNRHISFLQFANIYDLPDTPDSSVRLYSGASVDHLSLINNYLNDESIRQLVVQWAFDKPTLKTVTIEPGNPLVTSIGRKYLDDYLKEGVVPVAEKDGSSGRSSPFTPYWSMERILRH